MTDLVSARWTAWSLLPSWARGPNLFRLVHVGALLLDAAIDALLIAVRMRYVGMYSAETAARQGAESNMTRGPNETADAFAIRLAQLWDVGKRTGDFLTMARKIQEYTSPARYTVRIVQNNGTRYTLDDAGGWTIDTVSWNWDGLAGAWSRFWVVLENTSLQVHGYMHEVGGDGAAVLQPSRCVGSDASRLNAATSSALDSAALQSIEEAYRPPWTHCSGILLLLDPATFWSEPPAGDWDYWTNRSAAALYWTGTQ